ncbi:MAG: class I SAM-dependent methyltransferase [Azospirillaceae bacterium]
MGSAGDGAGGGQVPPGQAPPEGRYYAPESLSVLTYDLQTLIFPTVIDGDLAFYADHARHRGGEVLELGVGTGRIAYGLAEAGCTVVGLDNSVAMLSLAEEKRADYPEAVQQRLRLSLGDMSDFGIDLWFDLAIAPFRALNHLEGRERWQRCLTAMHTPLRDGGRGIVHIFVPDEAVLRRSGEAPEGPPVHIDLPASEAAVEFFVVRRLVDRARRCLSQLVEFRLLDSAGQTQRHSREWLTYHWQSREEMAEMVALAGFAEMAVFGDFHASPPRPGTDQIWVLDKRK